MNPMALQPGRSLTVAALTGAGIQPGVSATGAAASRRSYAARAARWAAIFLVRASAWPVQSFPTRTFDGEYFGGLRALLADHGVARLRQLLRLGQFAQGFLEIGHGGLNIGAGFLVEDHWPSITCSTMNLLAGPRPPSR
jgi:hypothetical protein